MSGSQLCMPLVSACLSHGHHYYNHCGAVAWPHSPVSIWLPLDYANSSLQCRLAECLALLIEKCVDWACCVCCWMLFKSLLSENRGSLNLRLARIRQTLSWKKKSIKKMLRDFTHSLATLKACLKVTGVSRACEQNWSQLLRRLTRSRPAWAVWDPVLRGKCWGYSLVVGRRLVQHAQARPRQDESLFFHRDTSSLPSQKLKCYLGFIFSFHETT